MLHQILLRACGVDATSGDAVRLPVDLVCLTDGTPVDFFAEHAHRVWDPDKVVITYDHLDRTRMAERLQAKRSFIEQQGVPAANVFGIGRHGLSHQIPAEHGRALPGTVYVGGDTQAATLGAMNCLAMAANESTYATLATGDIWMIVPDVVSVRLEGRLGPGLVAKDVTETMVATLGGDVEGTVVEISGPALADLSVDTRLGIATVANSLGALAMIFPADQVLLDYLDGRTEQQFRPVHPGSSAEYTRSFVVDLAAVTHRVRGPDDAAPSAPVEALAGLEVTAAYVGSCSSARLEDLSVVADIVRGRHVHPSVRFVVTPISSLVAADAARRGLLADMLDAGVTVTTPGCGACFAGNQSPLLLGPGERCITSSVENNRGRMGDETADIYISSPAVVAASALAGRITDPR